MDNTISFTNYKASRAYLNNAAFGKAYNECYILSSKLHEFSESDPDVYYDQALLPLIENSYEIASDFFKTKNLVLTPNCTIGLKAVVDTLVKTKKHHSFAYLSPLYGATQKLLAHLVESDLEGNTKVKNIEVPNWLF